MKKYTDIIKLILLVIMLSSTRAYGEDDDKTQVQGYYWTSGGFNASTSFAVAMLRCGDQSSCFSVQIKSQTETRYVYERCTEAGICYTTGTYVVSREGCNGKEDDYCEYTGPNPSQCGAVTGTDLDVGWFSTVYGKDLVSNYWCASSGGGCIAAYNAGTHFCGTVSVGQYDCIAKYTVIGPECNLSESSDDSFCKDATCTDFVSKEEGGGGNEVPDIDVPPPVIDPTDPPGRPGTQLPDDVMAGLLADFYFDNTNQLYALNENFVRFKGNNDYQLRLLNANVRQNTEYVNKLVNKDSDDSNMVNAIDSNRVSTESAIHNSADRIVSAIGSIESGDSNVEAIGELGDRIESLVSVDTSNVGIEGSCITNGNCEGFYDSKYPEGLTGLLNEHMSNLQVNVVDKFVSSFGTLDVSNAARPSFEFPILDFGVFNIEDYIDLSFIFSFIRVCMLFYAAMTARKLIFGG